MLELEPESQNIKVSVLPCHTHMMNEGTDLFSPPMKKGWSPLILARFTSVAVPSNRRVLSGAVATHQPVFQQYPQAFQDDVPCNVTKQTYTGPSGLGVWRTLQTFVQEQMIRASGAVSNALSAQHHNGIRYKRRNSKGISASVSRSDSGSAVLALSELHCTDLYGSVNAFRAAVEAVAV